MGCCFGRSGYLSAVLEDYGEFLYLCVVRIDKSKRESDVTQKATRGHVLAATER